LDERFSVDRTLIKAWASPQEFHDERRQPDAIRTFTSSTETATGFPGATGTRPQTITPLAEVLRLNGYRTA